MLQTKNGEADKQETRNNTLDDVESDPEDIAFDELLMMQMVSKADRIVAMNMLKIIKCIGDNVIQKNHAPSVRILFEIASKHNNRQPISRAEYESFAETLAGMPGFVGDSVEKDDEQGEQE